MGFLWGGDKMPWNKTVVILTQLPMLCVLSRSVLSDFVTPWTVAHQASLSMGFSRQEY